MVRRPGGLPLVSTCTSRVASRASVPAHSGTWTGGVKVVLRPAAVSATLPRGPVHTPGTQTHGGVRCAEKEESPSSGSVLPAASDGLFHLESHSPLCCSGFSTVGPSAPTPPTPTRLRLSGDGRREGRSWRRHRSRAWLGSGPHPLTPGAEPNPTWIQGPETAHRRLPTECGKPA